MLTVRYSVTKKAARSADILHWHIGMNALQVSTQFFLSNLQLVSHHRFLQSFFPHLMFVAPRIYCIYVYAMNGLYMSAAEQLFNARPSGE